MIATENEAGTKMCFKAATFGGSQQLADGPGPHCIGAGCMAWDWEDGELEYRSVDFVGAYAKPEIKEFKLPEGDGWQPYGIPFNPDHKGNYWRMGFKRAYGERRRGFCGLARRSEVVVTTP